MTHKTDFALNVEPVIRALHALQAIGASTETLLEESIVERATAGKAAYASFATYHNQTASSLAIYLQRPGSGSFWEELNHWGDDSYPSGAKHRVYLLSTLVPLNEPARIEMDNAAMRLAEETARLAKERMVNSDDLLGHLHSAVVQSVPGDDQIIMDHVKAALVLVKKGRAR